MLKLHRTKDANSNAEKGPSKTAHLPHWRYVLTKRQRMKLQPPRWLRRASSQIIHLYRQRRDIDFEVAKSVVFGWKSGVMETWKLLEDRRLPHEESYSPELRQLLEPAEGQEGSGTPTVESIKAAWEGLDWPEQRRREEWPHLMLAALRACPDRAPLVFQATFDADAVPSYMAEDTIEFLLQMREDPPNPADASVDKEVKDTSVKGPNGANDDTGPAHQSGLPAAQDIFAMLRLVFEKSPQDYLRLRQASLYFFARMLGGTLDDVATLYEDLVRYKHPMHKNTRLQIAGRLAGGKLPTHKTLAVNVLQTALAETDLDINTPQGAALCTAILTTSKADQAEASRLEPVNGGAEPDSTSPAIDSAATPAELFDLLLQSGLEPNLITYTTIIRGLCLKQELDAAIQVVQLMLSEAKTEPDSHVYSILMNGAKLGGNYHIIQQVAQSAVIKGVRDPVVWNDFLQAIYAAAAKEARQEQGAKRPLAIPAFPLMVQAYARIFEIAPLRKLLPDVNLERVAAADRVDGFFGAAGSFQANKSWHFLEQLAPTVRSLPQLTPVELVEPTGSTLATIIQGYIQGLSNPYDVIAFYTHFRRLLQSGDPTAMRLVRSQGTQIHDCIVLALTEYEGMLRAALDVVGDMLRDSAADAEAGASPDLDKAVAASVIGHHPAPSVYTWSILLNGFMFHRQFKQGERVLEMMRQRGVEPNDVTWNTLLAGYARAQKGGKTLNAFDQMERAGMAPDSFSYRALSYLKDDSSVLQRIQLRQARRAENATRSGVDGNMSSADFFSPEAAYADPLSSPGSGRAKDGMRSNNVRELQGLQGEVAEIAKMMDEEQRDIAGEGGDERNW